MKSPKKGRPDRRPGRPSRPKNGYRPLVELLEDRLPPGDALSGLSLLGTEPTSTTLDPPAVSSGDAVNGVVLDQSSSVGYSAGGTSSTTTSTTDPGTIVTSPTTTTGATSTSTTSAGATAIEAGLTAAVSVSSQDLTPPDVDLDVPDFTNNPSLTIRMHASDNVRLAGSFAIDVDLNHDRQFHGGELNYRSGLLTGGNGVATIQQMPAGTFDLRARVKDAVGNVGVATATVLVDPNAGKIGDTRLLSLMARYPGAAADSPTGQPDPSFFQPYIDNYGMMFDAQNRVAVNARAVHSQWVGELRQNLEALGMEVVHTRNAHAQVLGWMPIDQLASLSSLPHFATAFGLWRPIVESGAVDAQAEQPPPDGGNDAERTLAFRNQFGATGQGRFVGVISDSADTLDAITSNPEIGIAESQLSGDLPFTGVFDIFDPLSPGTDEGRAMLEIIHDIAPDARLAFASGVFGIDFALDLLTSPVGFTFPGCTEVVDDLSDPTAPIYNDGITSQAIDGAVLNKNVVYAGSAGNAGSWGMEFTGLTQSRWVSNVLDPIRVPIPAGIYLDMNAGPAIDIFSNITLTSDDGINVFMHWDQSYLEGGTFLPGFQVQNDLDILIVNLTPGANFGVIEASSQLRNQIIDMAFEGVGFTGNDSEPFYGIAIRKVGSGPFPGRVRLTRRGDPETNTSVMQYQTRLSNPAIPLLGSPTIFGNHTATQMLAVAAMPWYALNANEYEGFTSPGVATILFDQVGTRLTVPQVRLKPDVTGMDGVNTSFFPDPDPLLGDIFNDSDLFPNFYGTSASAPMVAAIAALMRSQAPGATAAQIIQHIRSTARDVTGDADLQEGFDAQHAPAGAGWDARTGFGLARAIPFTPGPPPPPPGGGGAGGIAGPPDRFEPNNTSNVATFVDLTAQAPPYSLAITGLTIHKSTIPDRDFFRTKVQFAGPMTITMDAAFTAGDLDLFVYTISSTGSLVLLGSGRTRSAGTDESVTVNVAVGKPVVIQVSGFVTSTVKNIGDYDLIISQ